MDPLSDILSLMKLGSYGFRGLDAGADWAISFPADDGIKCYAIHSGECWLSFEEAKPMRLAAGDFVLLPSGKPFRLSSATNAPLLEAYAFFSAVMVGETAILNGGGGCSGIGGYFQLEGLHAELLFGVLPPVVHISVESSKSALRWFIERLMRELREPQPGSTLIAEHLAQTLFVEALRLHLTERSQHSTGWLFALADRQMHAVIAAMHADPARKWTLHDMARVAGMSRSSFAARFKETVGEPPMDYLIRWRMMIAADRLANRGMSISIVAPTVGYESESAFGAAFKRVFGYAPKQFAKAKAH
jgi:AraC-like DNA-binding protein